MRKLLLVLIICLVSGFTFFADNTPPQLRGLGKKQEIYQGQTLKIKFVGSEELASVNGLFRNKKVGFYRSGSKYVALLGFDSYAKTGGYTFKIKAADLAGNSTEESVKIELLAGQFWKEKLFFSSAKQGLMTEKSVQDDQAKLSAVLTKESEQKFWEGRFILPFAGPVSSSFGARRMYGETTYGVHNGIDYVGAAGADILCANHGQVVFADYLRLHGNTIVVDHGLGVFTIYCHLQEKAVKAGDRVKKGQVIGYLGGTGLATGPHLHWGLSLHDVRVDPLEWVEKVWL